MHLQSPCPFTSTTSRVARCDLYWPTFSEARTNQQYVWLNDTLVAPIFSSTANLTQRSVWIPPGTWRDAWDGSDVTGPRTVTVARPYEQQPMWHRVGGLMVLTSDPGLRVGTQDWSTLTLEAFVDTGGNRSAAAVDSVVRRRVHALGSGARTDITMVTSADSGLVRFIISPVDDVSPRAWCIRLHLRLGQTVEKVVVDGAESANAGVPVTLLSARGEHVPFGGQGSSPATRAGPVVELMLPHAGGGGRRTVEASVIS